MKASPEVILSSVMIAAALFTGPASAQGAGGGLRVGASGFGLEIESLLTDRFGVRSLSNSGPASVGYEGVGIRYDGTQRFGAGLLLADWHPYANGLRLTGGLAYSSARFGARPAGTNNGTGAAYSQTGLVLDARSLSRASPYLGVGWGLSPRAGSRLYFSADLGVMYQRSGASLMGCGAALPAGLCGLQSDLRSDEAELREAAGDLRLSPVVSFGFGLRF